MLVAYDWFVHFLKICKGSYHNICVIVFLVKAYQLFPIFGDGGGQDISKKTFCEPILCFLVNLALPK